MFASMKSCRLLLPRRIALYRWIVAILGIFFVSLFLAASGPAQEPQPMTFGSQVEVRWVLVPVVVKGRSGYARGLEARDFQLRVEGRALPRFDFESRKDAPVDFIFLQDLSGSMANGRKLAVSSRILGCFLDLARPGDRMAVATFAGGRLEVQVPMTEELSQLRQASGHWQAHGSTALHDAVAWLPDLARGSKANKSVAILITDGVDNASILSPEAARELVRQAEIPVYVVGLATGTPFALDAEGKKLHRLADVLNLLAHHTGGRYEPLDPGQAVSPLCSAILEDVRHQYILSFPAQAGGPTFRSIEVAVRGRHRKATYRRGYLGGPPALP
jgi:VWFA-related protein